MIKLIAVSLLATLVFSSEIFANQMGASMPVKAIGTSIDYIHSFDGDKRNDGAVFLSGKAGYFGFFSFLASADAGYKIREKSYSGKLGLQTMILFAGIEAGFSSKYKTDDDSKKYFPGAYTGLCFTYPANSSSLISAAAGFNFYSRKSENEFYFKLGYLFNFAD
ncbi:MAG TPA: hypothetical protein PK624_05230 [Spirochaetota bacterium]|nr:hypothetical protein [Spirochaetota bacterium]HOR44180.1 hypothetical protein [Spirochaetota bacterium]HPK55142.1 hypothetical protein [Spirochaetota bacterium]